MDSTIPSKEGQSKYLLGIITFVISLLAISEINPIRKRSGVGESYLGTLCYFADCFGTLALW